MAISQQIPVDSSTRPRVLSDGFDDDELEQYQGDLSSMVGEALSKYQSVVGKSSAIDYIETACSFLDKVQSDYNEIRNIVTGGFADGWYPASLPWASPPSCLGAFQYFAPLMPVPAQMTPCVASTNQVIMPSLAVNAPAAQSQNNVEVVQQIGATPACGSTALPAQRTPLRSGAELFQPVTEEQNKDTPAESTPLTTLMLKNIPQEVSRSMLLDVIRSSGFANHVAFVYLPMNLRSSGNFGYAFVDFDCAKVAEQCKERLEGFTGWGRTNDMVLEVVWSETQGLDSLVQRYRDSPLMHKSVEDELKPAMFKTGVRIAFPPPTKPIRAPRLRKTAAK